MVGAGGGGRGAGAGVVIGHGPAKARAAGEGAGASDRAERDSGRFVAVGHIVRVLGDAGGTRGPIGRRRRGADRGAGRHEVAAAPRSVRAVAPEAVGGSGRRATGSERLNRRRGRRASRPGGRCRWCSPGSGIVASARRAGARPLAASYSSWASGSLEVWGTVEGGEAVVGIVVEGRGPSSPGGARWPCRRWRRRCRVAARPLPSGPGRPGR